MGDSDVFVQHFQIMHSRLVGTSRSPIQRLLFAYIRIPETNRKSTVYNSTSRLESLSRKSSFHALNTSETETISIPMIIKMAGLYYNGTQSSNSDITVHNSGLSSVLLKKKSTAPSSRLFSEAIGTAKASRNIVWKSFIDQNIDYVFSTSH